ncbi:hypothetical protein FGO68_gene889 [Halteria grandinella]|uniref:Uncharacterized protein n=1 Tax=Halteria grandinella TaxID=5974 RepID=A0A8J8T9L7_HALGN|nr:hypothetical protein FGO68_gene889 [Halteria grandinella]
MEHCHQQDFLPFECDGCKVIFCTEHARAEDHKCRLPSDYDSIIVIICPICEMRIKLKKKDDPNEAWNRHSLDGTCAPKLHAGGKQVMRKCMAEKCYVRLNSINSVSCAKCLKEVCLKHRFEDDHQCTHIVTPIRNDKTAKSKLLQPGYFKDQQSQPAPVISQSEHQTLQSNINRFGAASQQEPVKQQQYQPERCELCGSLFLDQNQFVEHVSSHFEEQSKPKTETQKCPHCPKRFAITELPRHMQMDHFIF